MTSTTALDPNVQLKGVSPNGVLASDMNVKFKGVSPIKVLAVVLYAHRTLGSSSTQASFALLSQTLMILSKVQVVTSTYPLD